MEGDKYIILLLDDQFFEIKIKEVLSGFPEYKLLFSLDDASLPSGKNNTLLVYTV